MATIDTSTIQGYETMTDSEKLTAVLGLEIPDRIDMSKYVPKTTADRYASEIAELKKKLSGRMSEEENAKSEAETAHRELQEKYDALLKESTISKYVAEYAGQGYSEELTKSTAEALYEGDFAKVFANNRTFKAELERATKAQVLKETPRPEGSGANGKSDKSDAENLAVSVGKAAGEAAKKANEVLKYYLGG